MAVNLHFLANPSQLSPKSDFALLPRCHSESIHHDLPSLYIRPGRSLPVPVTFLPLETNSQLSLTAHRVPLTATRGAQPYAYTLCPHNIHTSLPTFANVDKSVASNGAGKHIIPSRSLLFWTGLIMLLILWTSVSHAFSLPVCGLV